MHRVLMASRRVKEYIKSNAPVAIFLIAGALFIWLAVSGNPIGRGRENPYVTKYNQGVDIYRAGQRDHAVSVFSEVAALNSGNKIKSRALFNIGALKAEEVFSADISVQQRWEALQIALANLKAVIRADPNDEDAKWNYEVLLTSRDSMQTDVGGGSDQGEQQGGSQTPGGSESGAGSADEQDKGF